MHLLRAGFLMFVIALCTSRSKAAAEHDFRFEKADAQSVAVAGEFSQWRPTAMTKQADGT